MRFHGMLLARDEEDILPQTLREFLTWCDAVYVFDLGSNDRTWEMVNDFAKRDERVVPWERRPTVYSDDLRCVLFHHYRDRIAEGDWVVKLDADEIFHVSPRRFVAEQLAAYESVVFLQWYFFRLTDRDVAAWESGAETMDDRARPVDERRRVYTIPEYSEPRLFRYRRSMRWPLGLTMPQNLGIPAAARIPIRHYPHRDPAQMQKRCELRYAMTRRRQHSVPHWKLDDWRQDVLHLSGPASVPATGQGLACIPGLADGPAYEWRPGEPLVPANFRSHLQPWYRRALARVVYGCGLPRWLDRRRPHFATPYRLAEIPEAENATI